MRSVLGIVAGVIAVVGVACRDAEPAPPAAGAEAAATEPPAESEALRFALCASNVASVDVVDLAEDKLAVHVMLNPDAASAFDALTANNLGRDLAVTAGDEILLAAPISARIASGVISAAPLPREEAERVGAALAALPDGPCGALSSAGN